MTIRYFDPFLGPDAKRPVESVAERLGWAFGGDAEAGGWSFTPSIESYRVDIEAVDYTGQTPGAVVQDCLRVIMGRYDFGPKRYGDE